jgi:hypothetical protein
LELAAAGAGASGLDDSSDSGEADPGSSFTVFNAMAEGLYLIAERKLQRSGRKVCNQRYVSVEM